MRESLNQSNAKLWSILWSQNQKSYKYTKGKLPWIKFIFKSWLDSCFFHGSVLLAWFSVVICCVVFPVSMRAIGWVWTPWPHSVGLLRHIPAPQPCTTVSQTTAWTLWSVLTVDIVVLATHVRARTTTEVEKLFLSSSELWGSYLRRIQWLMFIHIVCPSLSERHNFLMDVSN